MMRTTLAAAALVLPALALARLPTPPLDDAARAKAAEAAAKAAWQARVDAYRLCKAQDRVVAAYRRSAGAALSTQAVVPAPAASAARPAASGPAVAEGGGTPVKDVATAPVAIPPCSDPGAFAFNPPQQTPLETSGAHSPAGNATQPPSVKQNSADMAPAR